MSGTLRRGMIVIISTDDLSQTALFNSAVACGAAHALRFANLSDYA
jgi:hypothetical protein